MDDEAMLALGGGPPLRSIMTKGERLELGQLIRKRERVMKVQAQERSAALLAEFDAQSAKIHHYDEDPVWQQSQAAAEKAVEDARLQIAARCRELGIPAEFAPDLNIYWSGRGHNAVASRRAELRRAAKSRIEAMERNLAILCRSAAARKGWKTRKRMADARVMAGGQDAD